MNTNSLVKCRVVWRYQYNKYYRSSCAHNSKKKSITLNRIFTGCFNRTVCTLAWTLVCEQLEPLPTVALKASDGVSAEVFAAAIVKLTLIDICGGTGEDILTALQPDVLHKSVTLTYCNNGPIPWCGWRLFVNSPSDLCMFFHPAVAWSRRGSCSAHLWMCLYRCSRTPHCSPHRFLKLQHTRRMYVNYLLSLGKNATLSLSVRPKILIKTHP